MLDYPSSFVGRIYLSEGEFYILDERGDFHSLRGQLFSPLNSFIKGIYNIEGHSISHEIEQASKEAFCEFLLKNKLYTLIEKEQIFNKIIY